MRGLEGGLEVWTRNRGQVGRADGRTDGRTDISRELTQVRRAVVGPCSRRDFGAVQRARGSSVQEAEAGQGAARGAAETGGGPEAGGGEEAHVRDWGDGGGDRDGA